MTSRASAAEVPDAELVAAARTGDQRAVVELWTRHYPATLAAARRTSRQLRDAEEIASDAFAGMLAALAAGKGPSGSVRAYLVVSVRNVAASRSRRSSSTDVLTDEDWVFDSPGRDADADPTSRHSELGLVRAAFASLPARWQTVLWRTAVDKDSNIEIGREMGLSPNGVAALATRARRGFRTAYLRVHLGSTTVDPACAPYIDALAELPAPGDPRHTEVLDHVDGCDACTARLSELRSVDRQLAVVLGPVVTALIPASLAAAAPAASGGPVALAAAAVGDGSQQATRTLPWWGVAGTVTLATVAAAVVVGVAAPGDDDVRGPDAAGAVEVVGPQSADSSSPPAGATTTPTGDADVLSVGRPGAGTSRGATVPGAGTRAPHLGGSVTGGPAGDDPPRPPGQHTPGSWSATSRQPSRTPRPATPSSPSTPTPSTTPRVTPTVDVTPVSMRLDLSRAADRTIAAVLVDARGVDGPLRLAVRVPEGVRLVSATGSWARCTQAGTLVECVGEAQDGRWRGTLVLAWPQDVRGWVVAQVRGTYVTGSPATGAVSSPWPVG